MSTEIPLFNQEHLEAARFPRLGSEELWFCIDEMDTKGLGWFLTEGWRLIEERDPVLVSKIEELIFHKAIREGEWKKQEVEQSMKAGAGVIYHALTIQEQESKDQEVLPLVSEGEFLVLSQSFEEEGEKGLVRSFEEFLFDFDRRLSELLKTVIGNLKTPSQAGDDLNINLKNFYAAAFVTYFTLASSAETKGLGDSIGFDSDF